MIYKIEMIVNKPNSKAVQKELSAIKDNEKEKREVKKASHCYRVIRVVSWKVGKKMFNFKLHQEYK